MASVRHIKSKLPRGLKQLPNHTVKGHFRRNFPTYSLLVSRLPVKSVSPRSAFRPIGRCCKLLYALNLVIYVIKLQMWVYGSTILLLIGTRFFILDILRQHPSQIFFIVFLLLALAARGSQGTRFLQIFLDGTVLRINLWICYIAVC